MFYILSAPCQCTSVKKTLSDETLGFPLEYCVTLIKSRRSSSKSFASQNVICVRMSRHPGHLHASDSKIIVLEKVQSLVRRRLSVQVFLGAAIDQPIKVQTSLTWISQSGKGIRKRKLPSKNQHCNVLHCNALLKILLGKI